MDKNPSGDIFKTPNVNENVNVNVNVNVNENVNGNVLLKKIKDKSFIS